jgi:trehalose 6-phosphate phosphatase
MADILARRNRPVLERFTRSNLLVAFDYDGTLAPIVTVPERAHMRVATHRLLRAVAERYPCVVISGRAKADVSRRLGDIPICHVSGNHGLEPWAEKAGYVATVQGWIAELLPRLVACEGVMLEDKIYSISIHYRRARHKRLALRAIDRAVKSLRGAHRIRGRQVVNVVPLGAPTKGDALEHVRRLLVCDAAVYVGDDETDEDVFVNGHRNHLLSVRVGHARHSHARYRLNHQRDVDRFLHQLLSLRPHRPASASSPCAPRS